MDKVIAPCRLAGRVSVPPSKSFFHRAVICAALANGVSEVLPYRFSEDIEATIQAMRAFGAQIEIKDDTLYIDGTDLKKQQAVTIDAGESGSTLRFLLPIASVLANTSGFYGRNRLIQRPITPFTRILDGQEIPYLYDGKLPITIQGSLQGGEIAVSGNISSQFLTGLLLCLPLFDKPGRVVLTTPLESKPYIDITLDVLRQFGVMIEHKDYETFVLQSGTYTPQNYIVERDFSQAAFFLVAAALENDITVCGMNEASVQGDGRIVDILRRVGCKVGFDCGEITITPGKLTAFREDVSDIPDLVPILALLAVFCEGETVLCNAARLRIKESDRLAATTAELTKLGARIIEKPDALHIIGTNALHGGNCTSHNDHRIVMMLAIAATKASGAVQIENAGAVDKSYPHFFDDYASLKR